MDESRKAFENLMSGKGWSVQKTDGGDYVHEKVHLMWMSWRESRAAIEIGIPSRINNVDLRTPLEVEDMWRDRMKSTLRAAGIKVKE